MVMLTRNIPRIMTTMMRMVLMILVKMRLKKTWMIIPNTLLAAVNVMAIVESMPNVTRYAN